jgi:ATP-dependent Clp protease protease subunit
MNEILIYEDIGQDWFGDGVTALSIKDQLDKISGDVTVRINSPGGDVFDGFAIYNLLAAHDGQINVVVDGLAASAASTIAMAGDTITMSDNALMMIHDPWSFAVGNAADMTKTAELLDKIKGSIVKTYQSHSGLDESEISELMTAETWLSADEAIEKGLATEKTESTVSISNIDKRWIKNAPPPDKIKDDEQTQTMWRVALNKRRISIL